MRFYIIEKGNKSNLTILFCIVYTMIKVLCVLRKGCVFMKSVKGNTTYVCRLVLTSANNNDIYKSLFGDSKEDHTHVYKKMVKTVKKDVIKNPEYDDFVSSGDETAFNDLSAIKDTDDKQNDMADLQRQNDLHIALAVSVTEDRFDKYKDMLGDKLHVYAKPGEPDVMYLQSDKKDAPMIEVETKKMFGHDDEDILAHYLDQVEACGRESFLMRQSEKFFSEKYKMFEVSDGYHKSFSIDTRHVNIRELASRHDKQDWYYLDNKGRNDKEARKEFERITKDRGYDKYLSHNVSAGSASFERQGVDAIAEGKCAVDAVTYKNAFVQPLSRHSRGVNNKYEYISNMSRHVRMIGSFNKDEQMAECGVRERTVDDMQQINDRSYQCQMQYGG